MKKLTRKQKNILLSRLILFVTGILISQWIFVIKDLSFVSNMLTLFLVAMCLKVGFSVED